MIIFQNTLNVTFNIVFAAIDEHKQILSLDALKVLKVYFAALSLVNETVLIVYTVDLVRRFTFYKFTVSDTLSGQFRIVISASAHTHTRTHTYTEKHTYHRDCICQ